MKKILSTLMVLGLLGGSGISVAANHKKSNSVEKTKTSKSLKKKKGVKKNKSKGRKRNVKKSRTATKQ